MFEFPRFRQQEEDLDQSSDTDSDIDPIPSMEEEEEQLTGCVEEGVPDLIAVGPTTRATVLVDGMMLAVGVM